MAVIESVKHETIEFLFKVHAVKEEGLIRGVFQSLPQEFVKIDAAPMSRIPAPQVRREDEFQEGSSEEMPPVEQYKRQEPKVGRNDPCPCGSGKKYKKCCGK